MVLLLLRRRRLRLLLLLGLLLPSIGAPHAAAAAAATTSFSTKHSPKKSRAAAFVRTAIPRGGGGGTDDDGATPAAAAVVEASIDSASSSPERNATTTTTDDDDDDDDDDDESGITGEEADPPSSSSVAVADADAVAAEADAADSEAEAGADAVPHEIISEEVAFERWRKVLKRVVRYPCGKVVDFDVVDQKGSGAVLAFAYDTRTKTCTVVREYNPGPHRVLFGPAAGIVESCPTKHGSDRLVAAKHELEEECHLGGGTWHPLLRDGATAAMDKYNACMISAYLVVDPVKVPDPRPLDEEEEIEIVGGVTIEELLEMVRGGQFNVVGGFAALLAVEKLRELGEHP